MWSCTRAQWAMLISDELNRFEKGLCRVAGPFFCVKGKVFSGAGWTDCHSSDRVFARSAVVGGRRDTWVPPYTHFCRAGPVCPAGCGKNSGRAVGVIGEALPVADEASRFRGSAPIGGHDSGRESVGTTVGNRRPLRMGCKRVRYVGPM